MKPMRVVLLIAGLIVGLIGVSLAGAGGLLVWEHLTQRDDDGYFTADAAGLGSTSYAVVSGALELGAQPAEWVPSNIATLRIATDDDVFIGIAPRADVRRYLRGVPHTELVDFSVDPFRPTYHEVSGDAEPAPPGDEDFWEATSRGGTLTWDIQSGEWSVVMMNADGSQGVRADVEVGFKSGLILPIGAVLLVIGLAITAGAVAMIVASFRGGRDRRTLPPGTMPTRPDAPPTPPPP